MEVTIQFKTESSYAHVRILNDDKSVQEKELSINDLASVFTVDEEKIYTLPNALFTSFTAEPIIEGLVAGRKGYSQTTGLFFLPAQKFYMNYAGEKDILPYPSLLFLLKEEQGILKSSKCFALKEETLDELSPESIIYAFPFGNVLASTGSICWGSNHFEQCNGYQELRSAISIFLSSESNMDYVSYGESFGGNIKTFPALLNSLKKKAHFPKEILIPSPVFKNLREICETIIY